jgi:predicted lipoprotein with Yx(FWY)xxD motif
MLKRWCVAGFLAAALVAITACGSSSSGGSTGSSGSAGSGSSSTSGDVMVKSVKSSIGTILESTSGKAIYWFAPDTKTKSMCNGSCATYWPPVLGHAEAASGTSLPGTFGTIKRNDGKTQATYDGHPLYYYAGDSSAGMVTGNDVNASGGLWWAMTPSGAKIKSTKAQPTPTSSGYSY